MALDMPLQSANCQRHKLKKLLSLRITAWFLQFSPYTESISMSTIIKESEKYDMARELKQSIRKGYIPKEKEESHSVPQNM